MVVSQGTSCAEAYGQGVRQLYTAIDTKEWTMAFTITGVHHVGITVRDLQRSFEWYSRMFNIEPGPVNHGSGPELEQGVQVEGAELSFSMIRIGNVNIEFLEYHQPEGKDWDRTNGDVGSAHICLEVDDMDAAFADLIAKGAVFNGPPVTLVGGDLDGAQWAYLRDPDGIQLEIWQNPKN
jgi:catechol 2,3-dioxygenase-like lactoylglutathione lyase family enzyme